MCRVPWAALFSHCGPGLDVLIGAFMGLFTYAYPILFDLPFAL